MKKSSVLGIAALSLLIAMGCREGSERVDAGGEYEEHSLRENAITGEDYNEYVARVQVMQQSYQNRFYAAMEADDVEEAGNVQDEFQVAAIEIMDDIGITPGQIEEFERQNPDYLQDPEVQDMILERIRELSQ